MTLDTNSIPIIAGPYRRNTPIRHRRNVTVWSVDRRIRYVRAWLNHPKPTTPLQYSRVVATCGGAAVVAGIVLGAIVR